MSISIELWKFQKRHNSTARPEGTGSTIVDVVFKKPTSINNPILILEFSEFPDYNYVVIPTLNMYYYIRDVVVGNANIFELHCTLDALATARPYINVCSAFVKYSTLNFNEYLKDDRIIPTADITTSVVNNYLQEIRDYSSNGATYQWILTVFSEDDGLCSYIVSWNQIKSLTQNLMQAGTSVWGSITQLFNDVQGALIDVHWCPITLERLQQADIAADNASRIKIGDWDSLIDGYELTSYQYTIGDDVISLSNKPSNFTLCSPYCEAKLYIPLIGTVDLSLEEFQDVSNVNFRYVINLQNGNVTCMIMKDAATKVIATYHGNCSYTVPLAFQQINGVNALVAGASAVAGIASGGALTIAGIAGSVASMFSAFKRSTSEIGTFGGNFYAGGNNLKLMIFKHGLSEQPENMTILYGRPCCKVLSMSTLLNGYVQTSQFQLEAPLDDEIIQQVNSLMDSGVYLE